MSATPVTVLRSGGEYHPHHVQWLARQVPNLVCLSDVPVKGVQTVPLRKGWAGWWSKMELFSNVIDGDLLHIDLDTVVLKPIDDLLNVGRSTMLSDFYRPNLAASGLMYIAQADKKAIWDAFNANPKYYMEKHRSFPLIGDQGFLNGRLKADRWQDVLPNAVVSYKVHCQQTVSDSARVVCFHGKPRPWEAGKGWIPKLEK